MKSLLTLFLTISLVGCATYKKEPCEPVKWFFYEVSPGEEPFACTSIENAKKLREERIRTKCQKK